MKHPVLIANWKEGPRNDAAVSTLCATLDDERVIVCPPERYREQVVACIKRAHVGAQDLTDSTTLRSCGIQYVIIGHSSRRRAGESEEDIAQKIREACKAGITPIICIGEEIKNDGGSGRAVKQQVATIMAAVPDDAKTSVYVAYEPVWAISENQNGVARPASVAEVRDMIYYLQQQFAHMKTCIHLLYGGSVDAESISDFLRIPGVVGVLVGAASSDVVRCAALMRVVSATPEY